MATKESLAARTRLLEKNAVLSGQPTRLPIWPIRPPQVAGSKRDFDGGLPWPRRVGSAAHPP